MTTAMVGLDMGHVIAVVLGRGHARFFDVTDRGAAELPSLHSPAMRGGKFHSDRQGGPGWGERDYHDRLHEEERRHLRAVVERLLRFDRERHADGLVLAGPGAETAALRRALPPPLAKRLIGTAHLNVKEATVASVASVARAARAAHEPVAEREAVAEMERGLGLGRATNGARETLRALSHGQVRTLLVRAGTQASGFRCAASQRLVQSATDCLEEGEPVPVPDLLEAASAEARRQRADVITIHDAEAAKHVEVLAALLRFPSRE